MTCSSTAFATFLATLASSATLVQAQGPPFQIDDPVPVDFQHYEFYIFGAVDGTPAETDSTGPALEFNWGAIPRVQLHAILPWGVVAPSNNPTYAPGGAGPREFGLTDTELGAKIASSRRPNCCRRSAPLQCSKCRREVTPKVSALGRSGTSFPFGCNKNIGHWLLDGGAGYQVVPQTGYRNFPYGGFLLKYSSGERLEIGGEVFSHAREGFAAPQTQASTMIDLGGYYHFKHHLENSFCSAMAIPWRAKQNNMLIWACTGPGEKIRVSRTRTARGCQDFYSRPHFDNDRLIDPRRIM